MKDLLTRFEKELPLTEGRRLILSLQDEPELESLIRMFGQYGLELYQNKISLGDGDCKKWAHSRVGVEGFDGWRGRHTIVQNEFKRFKARDELMTGNLVGYFNSGSDGSDITFSHWGVCEETASGLMILSRWGKQGHVFRHPIELVPEIYGNFVNYIEVLPTEYNH